MDQTNCNKGMIHLLVGPMFSGKSTELFRLTNRQYLGGKTVVIVKYAKDVRYNNEYASTHDRLTKEAISAIHLKDIFDEIKQFEVIGIDEGQFFDDVTEYCEKLANLGKFVYVAALDGDFKRKPFPSITNLYPLSEKINKMHAVCRSCGNIASFTFRTIVNDTVEVIGGSEMYKAVCRECYIIFENQKNIIDNENTICTTILSKSVFSVLHVNTDENIPTQ
uniref:Thymidine kinase n=1 Tax=Rhabditophanes sp. KR3021 TaxID=114890 RepID=A0AC35TJU5_9BILA